MTTKSPAPMKVANGLIVWLVTVIAFYFILRAARYPCWCAIFLALVVGLVFLLWFVPPSSIESYSKDTASAIYGAIILLTPLVILYFAVERGLCEKC